MEVIEQCFDLNLLVTRYWKTYHVQCNYFVAVLSKTVVPYITHTFDIKLEFLLLKTLEHVVYTSTVFHPLPFFFCSLILIRDKHSFVPIGRPGYKTEIESSGKRGCDGGD